MKVVNTLDFPGDKKDKVLAKANQVTKKDNSGAALKKAAKRVGELEQWLTLVLCYCPDVAALDEFLQMSMHINRAAAPTPSAPAMPLPIKADAPNDDPWAHEGVPPQSATDPWRDSAQRAEAADTAGTGGSGTTGGDNAALVVQDYTPSFEGAVAVEADEVVAILDDSNPDWWLVRTSDGREGAVPSDFLDKYDGGFADAGEQAHFASAATFAAGSAPAPALAPVEERILMVLKNEHVPFAQKIKTSISSLGELEELVQQRLQLQFPINLCVLHRACILRHTTCHLLRVLPCRWCALPTGNGEPERVTDLSVLPMQAKVHVKPGLVNLIAVVHNGDLEHNLAMEVADVVSRAAGCFGPITVLSLCFLSDPGCVHLLAFSFFSRHHKYQPLSVALQTNRHQIPCAWECRRKLQTASRGI